MTVPTLRALWITPGGDVVFSKRSTWFRSGALALVDLSGEQRTFRAPERRFLLGWRWSTTGGAAQDGAYTASTSRPCLPGSLRTRRHPWPVGQPHARERVFLLFVLVSAFAVWMSGSITWAVVAVGAVATVVFFDWYRMGHMQVLALPETHRSPWRR